MTPVVQRSGRRLAAVLAADVAGYVRLMEADEDGVHQQLMALRLKTIDPAVAAAGGHIVKNTGDRFFATFDNVRDAFKCARRVQGKIAKIESSQPKNNRIAFRMAVNLCELIEQNGDVFGDGVNIAARLQHFAPPGGLHRLGGGARAAREPGTTCASGSGLSAAQASGTAGARLCGPLRRRTRRCLRPRSRLPSRRLRCCLSAACSRKRTTPISPRGSPRTLWAR